MNYRTKIPKNEPLIWNGVELKSPFMRATPFTTLEILDIMVVLYTNASGGVLEKELGVCNVCAFDRFGEIVWIIEPNGGVDAEPSDFLVDLGGNEETGELVVWTFGESRLYVDLKTGRILKRLSRDV